MARQSTTNLAPSIQIDVSELEQLPKALKNLDKKARRELMRGLRHAGSLIRDGARVRVLGVEVHHSRGSKEDIAASIRTTLGGIHVKVVAGGSGTPFPARMLIPLWELGGAASRAYWEHPVFGTSTIVKQASHPFLMPAMLAGQTAAEVEALKAIDIAIEAFLSARLADTGGEKDEFEDDL